MRSDEDQPASSRNRPEVDFAIVRILAREADANIVWNVSRLSRNWWQTADDLELPI